MYFDIFFPEFDPLSEDSKSVSERKQLQINVTTLSHFVIL